MFVRLFPLWVIIAAVGGAFVPQWFLGLKGLVVPLLMVVMLTMGLTLKPADFYRLKNLKSAAALGLALQFSVMPLMALAIATLFQLDKDLTTGLVLVGSVAGGTASNVITLLARGNVALSVSMTALSTLASVIMTPLLMTWLAGSTVNVPAIAMIASLFKIIILPVGLGVLCNVVAESFVTIVRPMLPGFSVIAVVTIIAVVVALNADRFTAMAFWVFAATLTHNISGLALGYGAAALCRFDRVVCRTIAIEVGMQNSGLAATLALKFFGAATALPGAIFSIWLNITGSVFASACIRADAKRETN